MTDWRDDLRKLLTEEDPNPWDDVTGSAAGQVATGALASDPANFLFKTLDAPFSVVRGGIGAASLLAEGQGLQGIEQGQERWDEAIMRMREADLGPLGILKTPMELGLNVALDPTTWTGLGLAGKAAKGLRATAELNALAGRPALSAAARGTARGLETAQWVNDVPGRKVLEGISIPKPIPVMGGKTVGLQPLVRAGANKLTRIKPGLLDPTVATRIRGIEDTVNKADNERISSSRYAAPTQQELPAIEQPLYHGSPEEGITVASVDIPLGERGNPNAASTLGVFTTPHKFVAEDYALGPLADRIPVEARTPDPVTGKVDVGYVYQADVETLKNPIDMEIHDFYSRFVRTDKKAMADARDFKAAAISAGHDGIRVVRESGIGKLPEQLTPDDIREVIHFGEVNVRPAHWNPMLTDQTNAVFDTPLPKSPQTYGQFLDEAELANSADMEYIASKYDWRKGLNPKKVLEVVADDPRATKIVEAWQKKRLDPLHASDPRAVARKDLVGALEKANGITYTRSTLPSLLVAAWKETALATPRFLAQNLQSNMLMQAIKGVRPTFGWDEYAGAFQADRHGQIVVTADEALEGAGYTQFARREGGRDHAPQELFRGGPREFSGTDRFTASPTGELVGRVTRSEKLATLTATTLDFFRQGGTAIDAVARGGSWNQIALDELNRLKPAYDARVAAKLAEVGVTDEVFSTVKKIGLPEEGMFALPLKRRFMELGLSDGNATHLVRSWAHDYNTAEEVGKVGSNKIMFDYNRTNLDDLVGKFIPFHYWPSRALRFWGEESLRNPVIPLTYMRMTDGIQDADDDPGLSARQKGFLHVMGTSLGFSLLLNPDGLFAFSRLVNLDSAFNEPEMEIDPLTGEEVPKDDSFVPTGETQLGHTLRWLKDRGYGLYPWLDSAFNVMGAYGNTFEPDFLPVRIKALVGAALNEVRAHTGMEPIGAPYADANGQLRQGVSTAVAAFLPDGMEPWLAQPVMARAGGSSQEANIDTIIEADVLARNPGITNDQMLAILSDPHSEEYEISYQRVSDAGLITELLGVILPTQVKMRHDARDVVRAQVDVIREEADRQNVLPWELNPTVDDLAFHAKYKRLTGKDYKPGDYETAKLIHDISRAPEAVKPLLLAEAEYNAIGSPKARGHHKAYWALMKGEDPAVAGLSDAGRQVMAANYMDAHPGAREAIDEMTAERKLYEDSHPEFAEFKAWQDRMYDLNTQLGGTLVEYRRQAVIENDNARRYFEDQWDWLTKTEPDPLERERRFEQATANMGAFIAITGKAKLRSLPGPTAGVPAVDVTLPHMLDPNASYGNYPRGQPTTDWRAETRYIY